MNGSIRERIAGLLRGKMTPKNILLACVLLVVVILAIFLGVKLAPVSATKMYFEEQQLEINVGESKPALVVFEPANASDQDLIFTCDNPEIAAVNKHGVVTGIKEGKARIAASNVKSGMLAYLDVTVKKAITGLRFDAAELTMKTGETKELAITVEPADAGTRSILYTSSDTKVVKMNGNTAQAVGVGEAVITAKDLNGKIKTEMKIKVEAGVVLALAEPAVTLSVGDTYTASVTFTPEDTPDKTLTWTSSDANIAAVDANGVITAVQEGVCTITATHAASGAAVAMQVTVQPAEEVTPADTEPDDDYDYEEPWYEPTTPDPTPAPTPTPDPASSDPSSEPSNPTPTPDPSPSDPSSEPSDPSEPDSPVTPSEDPSIPWSPNREQR